MNKLNYLLKKLLPHLCVVLLVFSNKVLSQSTIVNYDFNSGSSYSTLTPTLTSNISCSVSSTEPWQTYTGISSGSNAFTSNSSAGNAIAMTNSSGTNTRYFQFQLGGADLSTYATYKVYLQAQRSSTGASTITLAYSTNGTSFTNFSTTQQSGNGAFNECQFDLSSVSALNLQSTVYFRVLVSGASSNTGTLRIDNFQVRATQQPCNSPTKLIFNTQPVSSAQGIIMTAFSVAAACANNIISSSCNSGTVTLTFSGSGISGTLSKPVVNGVATFTNVAINPLQNNVSFSATYSGSCGSLTNATSNTFSVLPLRNENFDGSIPAWNYSVGTATVVGSGGTTGIDVTGLKNFGSPNNNSLCKSYSVDNASGEKGSSNTITFDNVSGLNTFAQVKFSFQIASLGSGTGAGTDVNEYLQLQTSIDGGTTWNSLLTNNGASDHLFALSSNTPVALSYSANAIYNSGDALWNKSAFEVNLPTGINQFRFRVTASSNRTNENLSIDNILLQGTPISVTASSNTQTISCSAPSATLTSTTSASNATYSWVGPTAGTAAGSTPTSSTTVVSAAGVYTVTATLPGSGSFATATVSIASNTTVPTLSITNSPTITCTSTTVVVTGTTSTAGATYSWSPGGITTSSISVSSANTFTLKVTNPANGCTKSSTIAVTSNTAVPTLSVTNSPSITCSTPTAVITSTSSTSGVTYSWSPSGITTSSLAVTAANTYTLKVTNPSNGCINSKTISVTTNTAAPSLSITNTPTLSVTNPTGILTATSSTSGVAYLWSPGGSSATSYSTEISFSGIYSVTVNDVNNGCLITSTVVVTEYLPFSAIVNNFENDSIEGLIKISNINFGVPPYNIAWNGVKIPNSSIVFNDFKSKFPSLNVDSLQFKNYIDTLKNKKNYENLVPGIYPISIYDNLNDSISAIALVGTKINWAIYKGVDIETKLINPRFHNGINYLYGQGEKITQTGAFAIGSNVAVASNRIINRYNNYIEFVYPDSKSVCYVGLQKDTSVIEELSSKTYFSFDGTGHFNINFLDSIIYSGDVSSNQVFSMANDTVTGKISFYRNGTLLTNRSFNRLNPEKGLLLKVVLGSLGSKVNGLIMKVGPIQLVNRITANVSDVTCSNPCSGIIDAVGTTALYSSPIKYELYNLNNPGILVNTVTYSGGVNHALFQNLCAGKYLVKYYCNLNPFIWLGGSTSGTPISFSNQVEIAFQPEWTNIAPTTSILAPNHTLKKTSGTSGLQDAGAETQNILSSYSNNGWLEWMPFTFNCTNEFGLSLESNPSNLNLNSINYGILTITFIWPGTSIPFNLYLSTLNGSIQGYAANINYPPTDKLKIEKNGNTILYFLNGSVFSISPTSVPNLNFRGDATIVPLNDVIYKPRLSFGCEIGDFYAELKRELDGNYYIAKQGNLKFKYNEEYVNNGIGLEYKIYDKNHNVIISNTTTGASLNLLYKDNRYTLNLFGILPAMPLGYYVLEVKDRKGEIKVLRFKL